jgi:hypothetical protein
MVRRPSTEGLRVVLALEVLALMLALPEAVIALRELWARRGVAGHTARPRTELEISLRLSIRRS